MPCGRGRTSSMCGGGDPWGSRWRTQCSGGRRSPACAGPAPHPPVRECGDAGRTFQMVGVRWKGTGSVRLQARSTSGTWTRWVELSQEAPAWTGPARRIRMRRNGDVRDLAVTFITSPRVGSPARGTVIPAVAAAGERHAGGVARRRVDPPGGAVVCAGPEMVFVHQRIPRPRRGARTRPGLSAASMLIMCA